MQQLPSKQPLNITLQDITRSWLTVYFDIVTNSKRYKLELYRDIYDVVCTLCYDDREQAEHDQRWVDSIIEDQKQSIF